MGLLLSPALLAQREIRVEVRHKHWLRSAPATLTISERGISFEELNKKKEVRHSGQWTFQDIQELKLSPAQLVIVTYKDRKWRLGADQEYEFELAPGQSFDAVYPLLKDRLDQRFVAALADPAAQVLWEIPVKLQGRFTGSEGFLQVGPERIIYKTDRQGQSRTWRYQDIENISSSGPFQLTVTTYERAKLHYGSLKGFSFQLKEPLDERRVNLVWRKLNQSKGLELLTSIQERNNQQ